MVAQGLHWPHSASWATATAPIDCWERRCPHGRRSHRFHRGGTPPSTPSTSWSANWLVQRATRSNSWPIRTWRTRARSTWIISVSPETQPMVATYSSSTTPGQEGATSPPRPYDFGPAEPRTYLYWSSPGGSPSGGRPPRQPGREAAWHHPTTKRTSALGLGVAARRATDDGRRAAQSPSIPARSHYGRPYGTRKEPRRTT